MHKHFIETTILHLVRRPPPRLAAAAALPEALPLLGLDRRVGEGRRPLHTMHRRRRPPPRRHSARCSGGERA